MLHNDVLFTREGHNNVLFTRYKPLLEFYDELCALLLTWSLTMCSLLKDIYTYIYILTVPLQSQSALYSLEATIGIQPSTMCSFTHSTINNVLFTH